MLLAGEAAVERHALEPRARFVSFGLSGVDPYRMLHGNPEACRAGAREGGADVGRHLRGRGSTKPSRPSSCSFSPTRVFTSGGMRATSNPNGGGISLGHPLGATGARITATLLNELERRGARYGIATMCIGQGQAIAGVLERLRGAPRMDQRS
jgi:acetyl-CoA C-acetyltransferase